MRDKASGTTQFDEDYQTLSRLNEEYVRAIEGMDVRWFENHLAPDFMNSNPNGSIVDRAGFLSQVAIGAGLSHIKATEVIVRILDDTAIIHARSAFNLPSGDAGEGRYTDIWMRRNGRWLCVAAQITRCWPAVHDLAAAEHRRGTRRAALSASYPRQS